MSRENNFDIVRLLLAVTVVFFHASVLSAIPSLASFPRIFSGELAVQGFFAVSGFLIFSSFERSKSIGQYFANRAWRILPAYWFSTVLCLAIGFSMGGFHVGKFLLANLTFANFLQPGIPGVFTDNPGNNAMNGALWTIKIELMFYVSVPVIVWLCRRLGRDAVLISLLLASIAFRVVFASHEKLILQLPGQLSFFLVGTLVYYHLAYFERYGRWLMAGAAALYAVHAWTGWFVLRPVSVGLLVMGACLLLPHIVGPTRWGDFSYGTYIVHYPIIQWMVAMGLFRNHVWASLLLLLLAVAGMASFSWFVIEKPALLHAKSGRLRHAALGDAPNFPPAVP